MTDHALYRSHNHHDSRPHVVIVGGGFAGISAMESLAKAPVDITLIDRNGYHTFQPLLYQVAAGGLNPGDVTMSFRAIAARQPNVRFRHGNVVQVDTQEQVVTLHDDTKITYDYLFIATGVTANFFGIPGAQEHSHIIYTRRDALATRDHLFSRLETLAQSVGKEGEFNIVVVGGGATGVEVAGAMAEMAVEALPRAYPELDPNKIRVYLVEMGEELLAPFKERIRDYTAAALEKRRVILKLGTAVEEITDDEVVLSDGSHIASKSIIWCTGVTAPEDVKRWQLPQGPGGRVLIDPECRVVGFQNVFAGGDVSADTVEPLPQLAQPATQHGTHVAAQIERLLAGEPLEPFQYDNKGIMATITRNAAVAQLPGGQTGATCPGAGTSTSSSATCTPNKASANISARQTASRGIRAGAPVLMRARPTRKRLGRAGTAGWCGPVCCCSRRPG
ncbi:MAG: NADH dehydrogenase FAD-containing subunit [Micrococcales bacterium]|nr:MAG: NADH dehydrogenase FAD-containing subunit [Micrococcales bacterium]